MSGRLYKWPGVARACTARSPHRWVVMDWAVGPLWKTEWLTCVACGESTRRRRIPGLTLALAAVVVACTAFLALVISWR